MTEAQASEARSAPSRPVGGSPLIVVSALGAGMILAWGSTFYLLAVLARPIADDTGWSLSWVVGALSIGFLVSGLVSPPVGRAIERHGGRPVLAVGAAIMALGLAGLALAPTLPLYVLAWIVVGAGMGAGLYDPAMAALGRLYGEAARRWITLLTLFGGFASTVCWPATALLVDAVGWRGTCAVYALIHLFVLLPLYLIVLPREARQVAPLRPTAERGAETPKRARLRPGRRQTVFVLVAISLTLASGITSAIGVHLLTLLQAQGIAFATAVALGTIVGPSQVGARLLEMLVGARVHPVWTAIASAALATAGLALLFGDVYLAAVGLAVYGAGNGLTSIVRGTLPLALFGAEGYATLMGRLGRPLLIAFAAAPFLAAVVLDRYGTAATIGAMVGVTSVNLLIGVLLSLLVRADRKRGERTASSY